MGHHHGRHSRHHHCFRTRLLVWLWRSEQPTRRKNVLYRWLLLLLCSRCRRCVVVGCGHFPCEGFYFFFSFSCRNNTEIGSTAEKKRSKSYIARQESVSLLHEPFFLLLYFVCRKRVPLPKIKTTKPFWLTCALVAEKRWRLPLHDTTYIPELQHVTYLSLHRLGQR